jgi:hypothetical protein
VYTPSGARNAIICNYAYRPERRAKYLAAVERLVNDDTPFDPAQFNWMKHSDDLVRYAPQYFDPERFNWKESSGFLVRYAPHHFDPE